MNTKYLQDLKKQFQKVEITRYDGRTTYVDCINEYELNYNKLEKIIKEVKFGNVIITDEKIIVCQKLKI